MSHNRRAPKLLAYLLAVPVFALVYVAALATRLAMALRPTVAALLGITVIGSTYAGEAIRRAPAKPIRAAAALGLAVILVAPAIAKLPVAAASDPQQAVVDLAMSTIGHDYVFGAEGPNKFDCSGLVYWVFKEAGELPRIGGSRMGARSYMRWFVARGRFSHDEADARPGDLVVWGDGHHIGIYIGPNRAVSALNPKLGVRQHDLKIPHAPTQYLLVNWGANDGGGNGGGGDNGGGNGGGGNNGGGDNPTPTPTPDDSGSAGNGASNGDTDFTPPDNQPTPEPTAAPATPKPPNVKPPEGGSTGTGQALSDSAVGTLPTTRSSKPAGTNGVAIATVNLRESPDVTSRILGWVGSGGFVRIVDSAYSPQGNLYFQVQTPSGTTGWVYSRWVLDTQ